MQTFELIPWIEDHRDGDASRFGTYRVAIATRRQMMNLNQKLIQLLSINFDI